VRAAVLTIALVSLSAMVLFSSEALANDDSHLAVGDPILRIQCPAGYTATL
jgi:hypothetical protein